jgi:NADPH-dependent 2,4-dienoyl-CoA reductase/sulfur reductase-like enzyme
MRLLVIGGVAAGLSAAARARRLDPNAQVTVLERGTTISWAACGLPYYLQGQVKSLDELIGYTPEAFAAERKVEVRTRAEVAAIQHSRREVVLAGGDRIPYDRLVLATGARPDPSGVDGWNQTQVFTLHTLDDAQRLKCFLDTRRSKRAVVIGTGYIGLEIAEALRANGIKVTMLASNSEVLGRTDESIVKPVLGQLERCGVEVRLNTRVRIIDVGMVEGIPCDLVVLATGLRPNVELAREAGIETGPTGGIRVSPGMETNLWGVYAAGDCAETMHVVSNRPMWLPLGSTANKMGRVAGANAAGGREVFPGHRGDHDCAGVRDGRGHDRPVREPGEAGWLSPGMRAYRSLRQAAVLPGQAGDCRIDRGPWVEAPVGRRGDGRRGSDGADQCDRDGTGNAVTR